MTLKNILVPVDLGPLSDAALARAVVLARPFGASITLLNVMKPQLPQLAMDPGTLGAAVGIKPPAQPSEDDRRSQLNELASRQMVPGVPVRTHVEVSHESVASTILQLAQRERSDLVVMSTHGRGGVERLVLGSVAEAVVRAAELPVLLIPRGVNGKDQDPSERQAVLEE